MQNVARSWCALLIFQNLDVNLVCLSVDRDLKLQRAASFPSKPDVALILSNEDYARSAQTRVPAAPRRPRCPAPPAPTVPSEHALSSRETCSPPRSALRQSPARAIFVSVRLRSSLESSLKRSRPTVRASRSAHQVPPHVPAVHSKSSPSRSTAVRSPVASRPRLAASRAPLRRKPPCMPHPRPPSQPTIPSNEASSTAPSTAESIHVSSAAAARAFRAAIPMLVQHIDAFPRGQ